MCFFSRQTQDAQRLSQRFNAKMKPDESFAPQETVSGFYFPKTPVISNLQPDIIQQFHWGLIPHWAKDNQIRQYTLNAKIETLAEKPAFRASVVKRCLVIADGFYEWQWLDAKGRRKQKYLLTLPDNELFAFGGIWAEWQHPLSGEKIQSYSIVTTEANELMSRIHNSKKRMPVVLSRENENDWLSGAPLQAFKKVEEWLVATKMS